MANEQKPVTLKQKIAIKLLLFAIRILQPFDYDHQYTDTIKAIESDLKLIE